MSDIDKEKLDVATPEVTDFLPDAIELRNEKLPWWARYSVAFAVIFMLGVILWASLGKVDVIVQANGKLVSNKPNIVMKPLERSVVDRVNVKIGDTVEKDQILVSFDPAFSTADAERLRGEIDTLTAQFERLKAEFDKVSYIPSQNNEQSRWQQAIYSQRQKFYDEKINYYESALRQMDATRKTRSDSLVKQQERLVAVKRIENMFSDLNSKKIASLKELLQISISRMEMEAGVDQIQNSLFELQHERESLVASRNSFVQEWRNALSEEMVRVERELLRTRKEYAKCEQLVAYVHLRSPCKAMVHEIAGFPPGSAVQEAEALITLIPLDGTIELEADLRPQDIGKVALGSQARVKLSAFPFQKHGTLDGVVRNISADTLKRQQQPTPENPGTDYYRARIEVSGKLAKVPENFQMIPGMEAQVEIKTGRRRIIEYLVHPLIKAFDESLREP